MAQNNNRSPHSSNQSICYCHQRRSWASGSSDQRAHSAGRGTGGAGFRLHPLPGRLSGHQAVSVSGDWRVTLRLEDGHAVDVDYADYH